MSSSPSPSSSAVTIPTPGKPILKRPPPPQQSFFSLRQLTKLLPTQNAPAASDSNDEARTLKRAHFILPEMTTVYPIYAANPPCSPALRDEKRVIEEREAERRKRIVRRNSVSPDTASQEEQWWSLEQVESFYKECCQGREELPDPAVSAAFLVRILLLCPHARPAHFAHVCSTHAALSPELSTYQACSLRLAPRRCCPTCSPSSGDCASSSSRSVISTNRSVDACSGRLRF